MENSKITNKRLFHEEYERLCVLRSICPLPHILQKLQENVLEINADRIHGNEWEPIIGAIHPNTSLKAITIKSRWQHNAEKSTNFPQKRTPVIHSREVIAKLIRALKDCLNRNKNLQSVILENLILKEKELILLSKGICRSKSLRYLSLKYCRTNDRIFEGFIKNIKTAQSLLSIDLTGCGLTWKSVNYLAEVIKYQSMVRHSEAWQESLRYRQPDTEKIHGLQRITLNENKIGDTGVRILSEVLLDDLWIKAIDLQQCNISNDGAAVLFEMLASNKTLDVLDLRGNKNIDVELVRAVIEKVMINSGGENPFHRWMLNKTDTKEKCNGKVTSRIKRRSTKNIRRKPPLSMPMKKSIHSKRSLVNTTFTYNSPVNDEKDANDVATSSSSSLFVHRESILKEIDELSEQVSFFKENFEREQMRRLAAEQHVKHLLEENEKMANEISSLKQHIKDLQNAQSIVEEEKRKTSENQKIVNRLEDDKVLESIESTYKEFQQFLDAVNNLGFGDLYNQIQQQKKE